MEKKALNAFAKSIGQGKPAHSWPADLSKKFC